MQVGVQAPTAVAMDWVSGVNETLKTRMHAPDPRGAQALPGPTLHVTLGEASFGASGRYFITLSAGGTEHRTAVAEESRTPSFPVTTYSFPLSGASSKFGLRIAATQLMYSRGSREVGVGSLGVGELVSRGELTVSLAATQLSAAPVGTVKVRWLVDDKAAEAKEAEERAAAERAKEEARAAEKAARWAAAAREMEAKRAAALREAEEAALREAAEEAARARADAEREAARRAAEAEAAAAAERVSLEARWASLLDSSTVLLTQTVAAEDEDEVGVEIELTGRQAVGLSDAAARSSSGMVAFAHAGRRVVLGATAAAALRRSLELQLAEQEAEQGEPERQGTPRVELRLSTPTSSAYRAVTAPPPVAAEDLAARVRNVPSAPAGRRGRVHAFSHRWLRAATMPLRSPRPPAPIS